MSFYLGGSLKRRAAVKKACRAGRSWARRKTQTAEASRFDGIPRRFRREFDRVRAGFYTCDWKRAEAVLARFGPPALQEDALARLRKTSRREIGIIASAFHFVSS